MRFSRYSPFAKRAKTNGAPPNLRAGGWAGFKDGDKPRGGNLFRFPKRGYVVSYLQASKEEEKREGMRKRACANNHTGQKGNETWGKRATG
ncbi:MAG TPA: hypothetical protein VJN89_07190 [Candidatus Acidoferrum sp.]|nr:hypothetical protein [Candidatus Acidoferrum sp.]